MQQLGRKDVARIGRHSMMGRCAAPECRRRARPGGWLALLTVALGVALAGPALAQDDDPDAPPPAKPAPMQLPAAPLPAVPSALPTINGQRQIYVPQHFNAQGQYVPPHYEAPKPMKFRGYFAADEQKRLTQKQHGYQEPTPDYTTPDDPSRDKPIEGR